MKIIWKYFIPFPVSLLFFSQPKTPERQWNYMLQNSTGMLHVYEPHLLHVWVCTLPSLVPSCVTTQHAQPPSWFFTSFGASFNTTSCTKHNIKENNTKTKQKKPKYWSLRTIKILHSWFSSKNLPWLCSHTIDILIWMFQNIHEI